MRCWLILGIKPTADRAIIRAAYAKKTHACHPEEDPEGFAELHAAYSEAMRYARAQSRRSEAGLPPEPPARPGREEPQEIGGEEPETPGGTYDFSSADTPTPAETAPTAQEESALAAPPAETAEPQEDLFAGYRFGEAPETAEVAAPPADEPPAEPAPADPGQTPPEDLFADYQFADAPPLPRRKPLPGSRGDGAAIPKRSVDEEEKLTHLRELLEQMQRSSDMPAGDAAPEAPALAEDAETPAEALPSAGVPSEPATGGEGPTEGAPEPLAEEVTDSTPVENVPDEAIPESTGSPGIPDDGEYDFGDLPAGLDSLWQEEEEPTPEGFARTRAEVTRRIRFENSEAAVLYPLKHGRLPAPELLIGGDRERAAEYPADAPVAAPPPAAAPDPDLPNEVAGESPKPAHRVLRIAVYMTALLLLFASGSDAGIGLRLLRTAVVGLMLLGWEQLLQERLPGVKRTAARLMRRWNAHLNRRSTRNCIAFALLCMGPLLVPEQSRPFGGGALFWLVGLSTMLYGFGVLAHVSRRWGVPPRHKTAVWWVTRGLQTFWFWVFFAALGPGVAAGFLLSCLAGWLLGAAPKKLPLGHVWVCWAVAFLLLALVPGLALSGYAEDLYMMLILGAMALPPVETARRVIQRRLTRK